MLSARANYVQTTSCDCNFDIKKWKKICNLIKGFLYCHTCLTSVWQY